MKVSKTVAAVVAACALMAVVASGASAATYQLSSYPGMTAGSQVGEHVFTVDGQTVKCKSANFETMEEKEAVKSLTVTAKYLECTAFGFVGANVSMGSCDYTFNEPTLTSADTYHSTVTVKCNSATEPIVITSSSAFGSCEVKIGAQTPEGLQMYTNITEGADKGKVSIETNQTGIKANVTKDTGICPLAGTGERANATYVGNSISAATGGASAFIG